MFDKNNANILNAATSGDTGRIVANNNMRLIYIPCKPNTTYTSQKIQGQNNNLSYTKETVQVGVEFYGRYFNQTGNSCTITTGEDAKYLVLVILDTSNEILTLEQVLNSIQIEQGSIATAYEEYIEQKMYVLNDNNMYEEFMKKEEISYNLKNKQINNTQGSWKPIQLDDNENFIVFIIKGSNYEDCRTIPKELVKKYSASSPLIIKFNNTIIAQLAWNAGNMVEYIWTSGYTIEHYAY